MQKSLKVPSFCSFSHYFDQCEYEKLKINLEDLASFKVPTFDSKFLRALTNMKNHYHYSHVGTLNFCLETPDSIEKELS